MPEEALESVEVRGITGWRAELMLACWCRFGSEQETNYGRWLIALTDRQLEALWRDYGSAVGQGWRPRILQALIPEIETVRDLLGEADLGRRLRVLLDSRAPALEPGFLAGIISKLEALEPAVDGIISPIVNDWEQPHSMTTGMLFSSRVSQLRKWVLGFLVDHGSLPVGRRSVKGLGWINFGREPRPIAW
jgi:hypothetical protein